MALLDLGGLRLAVAREGTRTGRALVVLHGFTGNGAEMFEVARRLEVDLERVAVDLVGHGGSDAPGDLARFDFPTAVADLGRMLDRLELDRVHLWGYSLGGRLALALALAQPKRVERLVLESASPGLKTEAERRSRRDDDEALARFVEDEGIEAFVDRWEALPLFAGDRALSPEVRRALRATRLAQRTAGLAGALRGLGVGAQQSLWSELPQLRAKTLLVTGAHDAKFDAIARQMAALIPGSRHLSLADSGHAPHRERPTETTAAIDEFLRSP